PQVWTTSGTPNAAFSFFQGVIVMMCTTPLKSETCCQSKRVKELPRAPLIQRREFYRWKGRSGMATRRRFFRALPLTDLDSELSFHRPPAYTRFNLPIGRFF